MICLVTLEIDGEVCSNIGISYFNGLVGREFEGKTRLLLPAQGRKNSLVIS